MNYYRLAITSGLLMLGVTVIVATVDDLTRSIPLFLALFALLFLLYGASIFALSRLHAPYRPTLVLIFAS